MKRKIKGYFKNLFKILAKPEMTILPSNIAFNIILAIIPILTIIVLIASSFDISIDIVTKLVRSIMPSQVSEVIIDVISGKGFDRNIGISNVLAFVLASNGTYAIINASDTLYKIENKDPIKKRINSFVILIIIIMLLLFLGIVPIFGENILTLLHKAKILEYYIDEIIIIYNVLKWPLTLFIIYFNIKLIYTIAPSKNIKSKETTIGALFTTIMWVMSTAVFKFYLRNPVYGSYAEERYWRTEDCAGRYGELWCCCTDCVIYCTTGSFTVRITISWSPAPALRNISGMWPQSSISPTATFFPIRSITKCCWISRICPRMRRSAS